MSSYDYTKAAATAARLLARFGAKVTVTQTTPGAYDPDTGLGAGTTQTWTPNAVRLDYKAQEIDGTVIKVGDQRIYMQALAGMELKPGAKVSIGSEIWNVIQSRPLAPAGIVVLNDVQVRK